MRLPAITGITIVWAAALLTGCSYLIDEDMSACGGEFIIHYTVQSDSSMEDEISTVLDEEKDIYVADALRCFLSDVFTDTARDVYFSFYEAPGGDVPPLKEVDAEMNAKEAGLSFYLESRDYFHSAVANVRDNAGAVLEKGNASAQMLSVLRTRSDTESRQRTGLFSARSRIDTRGLQGGTFQVGLYMVNAASALVLDRSSDGGVCSIQAVAGGFADAFMVCDSSYVFSSDYDVQADDLKVEQGTEDCLVAVSFPSRDEDLSGLWRWRVYATLPDGSVTESALSLSEPLKAGMLKIIKAKVYDTGVVAVEDPTVGVSVTLDWHEGGNHVIDF